MLHFSRFSIGLISLILLFYHAECAELGYHLRINKADSCDHSNTTYILKNVTVKREQNQDHLYTEVDLLKDVVAAGVTVEVEKCVKTSLQSCERLSNFVINDFCSIFKMKNTFWYPMIAAIKPTPDCPNIKKGDYIMDKGSMNMNNLIKLFPDSVIYVWKLKITLTDIDRNTFACGTVEGSLEEL